MNGANGLTSAVSGRVPCRNVPNPSGDCRGPWIIHPAAGHSSAIVGIARQLRTQPGGCSAPTFMAMQRQQKTESRPFSLRFTAEEREALERRAGRMPLGTYIRSQLFEGMQASRRRDRPRRVQGVVKDHKLLGQILGTLGQSGIARSLHQLAEAARIGTLQLAPETEALLRAACKAVLEMKRLLMVALGIKER